MKSKNTNNQKELPILFYKFRFLTIQQLQKYFNHKDPHRVKVWLKSLKDNGYIFAIADKKDPTKPHIFCLDTKARNLLKDNKDCDQNTLKRLYKEKALTEPFRNHCLFLFETYLYFLSRKEKGTTLHFLTQRDLIGYDFFPEDSPDAYIASETKEGTDRYFLDLYDEYKSKAFLPRRRIKQYIRYCEEGNWQANTDNAPFPAVLFVLPNEKRKTHIYHYGKAILEKTYEDVSLFLTTQDKIKYSKGDINIWQAVE